MPIFSVPNDQQRPHSVAYEQGVTAAANGRHADACPFPTGENRKHWLAGFFSAKFSLIKPACIGPADACKSR